MQTNLEVLRIAVINRIEIAKLFETLGRQPWTVTKNAVYDQCKSPQVSVIITLYNYADYIYECLVSVTASYKDERLIDFEIVIINDCSTDNSVSIVQDYLKIDGDTPICLVNKHINTGLADARNLGLNLARAPYVFMLDADNWIYPNCLSELYREIYESKYASVYGIIQKFNNKTRDGIGLLSQYEWDTYSLIKGPYIDAMAMFDRAILLSLGGYSTELIQYGWFGWEDYDMWLKLAQANYVCKLVPQILSAYRSHPESMINLTNSYLSNFSKYFMRKFASLTHQYIDEGFFFGSQTPEKMSTIQDFLLELETSRGVLQAIETEINQLKEHIKNHVIEVDQWNVLEVNELRDRIFAMETSKFWQMRKWWFKFKKILGMPSNE